MASIVKSRGRSWEVRESERTAEGPRSRTLATFRQLDDEAIEKALSRAKSKLTPEDLIAGAKRAGAPIAPAPADQAAQRLLAALRAGKPPRPALRRLLAGELRAEPPPSDVIEAAAEWVGASLEERGETLRNLLLFADAIPSRRRPPQLSFPPIARTNQ